MKKSLVLFFAFLCAWSACFAEDEGIDVTAYNQNFALIRERRFLDLAKGINQVRFSDIPAFIEPASVYFHSLTAPESCAIEEQNYEYDLVSATKLLSKYIDKKIKILAKEGAVYEGRLASYDSDNIVVSGQQGTLFLVGRKDNIQNISFSEPPEGLITKPTLMWRINNERPGKHLTEISYLTKGVNWMCDYVAVVNKEDKAIDLYAWVTVDNKSGVTYKNAGLKLVAGDVNRAKEGISTADAFELREAKTAAPSSQFKEKAFFEYHIYNLQRKTTLKDNQIKQITLLTASAVPVAKLFICDPNYDYNWYRQSDKTAEQKVKVKLEIVNSEKNNLGMPLPRGKVKVYKQDTDEKLEFVGEDWIDHTSKDEKVRLYLGDAFDVVAERKRMDFKTFGKTADETIEVTLRNHKKEDIEVIVVEKLWRYMNWEIISKTHGFVKKDAQTAEFKVSVPSDAEVTLKYTVHYWS